jgi:hypothetical protein
MEDIINKINIAFGSTQAPSKAEMLDERLSDESEIIHLMSIRRWQDVKPETLMKLHSALPALSPKAFKFFLPAFMVWAIENRFKSDSFTLDSTIYALNPFFRGKLNSYAQSKLEGFCKEQVSIIITFLELMASDEGGNADRDSARSALDRYWNLLQSRR